MKNPTLFLLVLSIGMLTSSATAQNDIYNNGATDGYTLGWTINYGFAVSNSFTLYHCGVNPGCDVNGVAFAAWLFTGDVMETAEVSITSSEFGGSSYFDQVVNFTQSGCFGNGFYNVCNETANFNPGFSLNAGTYWLNLSNAAASNGDPIYWDQNAGPSRASQSSVGTMPSESFSILGDTGTTCEPCGCGAACGEPTSPEPGSLLLFGSGVMALLLAGVHKFR